MFDCVSTLFNGMYDVFVPPPAPSAHEQLRCELEAMLNAVPSVHRSSRSRRRVPRAPCDIPMEGSFSGVEG